MMRGPLRRPSFLYGKEGGKMDSHKLTEKQQRFVDFYIETGNAAEAARRAGYSARNARKIGSANIKRECIRQAVDDRMQKIKSQRIADAQEVMEYLTAVMRGESVEEVVIIEGRGRGVSEARIIDKHASIAERNKAAEMIAKRYNLFNDPAESGGEIVIIDDLEEMLERGTILK